MRTSTDRILTTHVGSLPRGAEVDGLFAIDAGETVDLEQHEAVVKREVGGARDGGRHSDDAVR